MSMFSLTGLTTLQVSLDTGECLLIRAYNRAELLLLQHVPERQPKPQTARKLPLSNVSSSGDHKTGACHVVKRSPTASMAPSHLF
jgi:hypothetical protein